MTAAPARRFSMAEEPKTPRDFAGLYRTTVAPLRRYLASLLRDDTEAQDVAHDAYLRIYPTVEKNAARKPEALLFTTARRLAINRLKRRNLAPISRDAAALDAHVSPQPGVAQQVMARQELQQLEEAIAGLPAGCRSVLLLRKLEFLSHREIADRLGITVSTVEKQHARALRLLRAKLAPTQATQPFHLPQEENP